MSGTTNRQMELREIKSIHSKYASRSLDSKKTLLDLLEPEEYISTPLADIVGKVVKDLHMQFQQELKLQTIVQ